MKRVYMMHTRYGRPVHLPKITGGSIVLKKSVVPRTNIKFIVR